MFILIEILIVFIFAVIVHELTHYIYTKLTGDFIKVDFDEGSPTIHFNDNMTDSHQIYMYFLAILSGMFVIIPFILFSTNGILHVVTLLIYLWGCKYDIDQILNRLNNNGSGNATNSARIT